MVDNLRLKRIIRQRLRTVQILIQADDWDVAAYMMGLVLECALKAAVCKTLKLIKYPEYTKNKKIDDYFMTHKFDQLLIVSGLSDVFSDRGNIDAYRNWSEFTSEFLGDWPTMRYDPERNWNALKVKNLYTNLTDPKHGILTEIKKRKKW